MARGSTGQGGRAVEAELAREAELAVEAELARGELARE
jgi:hypothetical protein